MQTQHEQTYRSCVCKSGFILLSFDRDWISGDGSLILCPSLITALVFSHDDFKEYEFFVEFLFKKVDLTALAEALRPVVQRADNSIQWINLYPADKMNST